MPGPPASRVSYAVKASASAPGKPPKMRKNAAAHPPFMFRLNPTPILYFEQLARTFNRTMFRLKIIADEQKSKREISHRPRRTSSRCRRALRSSPAVPLLSTSSKSIATAAPSPSSPAPSPIDWSILKTRRSIPSPPRAEQWTPTERASAVCHIRTGVQAKDG